MILSNLALHGGVFLLIKISSRSQFDSSSNFA